MSTSLELMVTDIDESVPTVRSFTMRSPNTGRLPGYAPGSHIVVQAGERTNAYSLTGDGISPNEYTISVLRVADGHGGSAWMHEAVKAGTVLQVDVPRSNFAPVAMAKKHLLIAGGIGITPMISHLRAARRWRRQAELIYGFRDGFAAHLADVSELGGRTATLHPDRDKFTAHIARALAEQPVGTHVYACGPPAMLEFVLTAAAELCWPESHVHIERFGVGQLDPGEPFEAVLASTGSRVQVDSGVTLLEALESQGVIVPNLCRQGVCGECRTPVIGGVPLHRDLFLTDEEKDLGDCIMPCVSRSQTPTLELPL